MEEIGAPKRGVGVDIPEEVDVPEVQQETKLREYNTLEYNSAQQSVKALQGCRCNGEFFWKIHGIKKKLREIQMGTTTALHSVPFHTSEFGYKMLARLGVSGHGDKTHISLHIVIMKGEYDDILRWPFEQIVTMMVLDQDENGVDITQSFRPNGCSECFDRPKIGMNLPYGCAKFAPMSLLWLPGYIKNNTMCIKIRVL